MGRKVIQVTCIEEGQKALGELAASQTKPKQAVERARMVLGCVEGKEVKEVARRCGTRPNTVIK